MALTGGSPAGRRRARRAGLGRVVVQGKLRNGSLFIVKRDRQGLLGIEPSAGQRVEWTFLPARRLHDADRRIGLDERKPAGRPNG